MCEERSDEQKVFVEERRYGMLFILTPRFSVLLSLRSCRPSLQTSLRLTSRCCLGSQSVRSRP